MELLGLDDREQLKEAYRGWVEEVFARDGHVRDTKWSETIAVGSAPFVEKMKEKLGIRAIGSEVVKTNDGYVK